MMSFLIAIALIVVAIGAVAALVRRNFGLALVYVALGVAIIWRDNLSPIEWIIFAVIFIIGYRVTSRETIAWVDAVGVRARTRTFWGQTLTGIVVLVVTVLLAFTISVGNMSAWMSSGGSGSSNPEPSASTTTRPRPTPSVSPSSASPSPTTSATTPPPSDGTAGIEDANGELRSLPLADQAGDEATPVNTTADPRSPATFDCPTLSRNWTEFVACIGDRQWYKDGVNARKSMTGFDWSDIERWAADGKGFDTRVIQVFNWSGISDADVRAQAATYVGTVAAGKMDIVRHDTCIVNTRGFGSEQVQDFVDCRKMVRVSLAPLVYTDGQVTGLRGDSGGFDDCANLWWLPRQFVKNGPPPARPAESRPAAPTPTQPTPTKPAPPPSKPAKPTLPPSPSTPPPVKPTPPPVKPTPTPTPTPSTPGPKPSAPPPPGQSPRPSGTTTASPEPRPTHTGPVLGSGTSTTAPAPAGDGNVAPTGAVNVGSGNNISGGPAAP